MPHTLVTGANSFVAAHVIDTLIAAGHTVTGSVRRSSAGEEVLAWHPEWKGKFNYVLVYDYAKPNTWDEIFKSQAFDYVAHIAAPLVDNPGNTDYDRDFLKPAVEGNLSLLRSAAAYAPALKSIVMTGSINALTMGSPEENASTTYINTLWNPITPEKAREAQNAYLSYCSSKKEGEIAVWDFVTSSSPSFSVTVILPALIFGPPIQPVHDVHSMNYSSNVFYNLWNGSHAEIPPTSFPSYIDVRDLAAAHVRALTEPQAANKRFLIGGEKLTYTDIVRTLAELAESEIPELQGRLPAESGENEKVVFAKVEADEGNRVLGLEGTLRTKTETFGDAARKILVLEMLQGGK